MRNIPRFMTQTIASSKCDIATRTHMVVSILRHKNPKFKFEKNEFKLFEQCRQYANRFTIKDWMDACVYEDDMYLRKHPLTKRRLMELVKGFDRKTKAEIIKALQRHGWLGKLSE